MSARSEGIDRFRIKIWDNTSGEIFYANNVSESDESNKDTELGGGNIVIHKNK